MKNARNDELCAAFAVGATFGFLLTAAAFLIPTLAMGG